MNCYICNSELDSFSKCTCCYDKKGAECDQLRSRNEALETAWSGLCKCACHDMPKHSTIQDLSEAVRFHSNKVKELEAEVERLRKALEKISEDNGDYLSSSIAKAALEASE